MALKLPNPSPSYDQQAEIRRNLALTQADALNQKTTTDVSIGGGRRLVIYDANGVAWNITVTTGGVLTATAL